MRAVLISMLLAGLFSTPSFARDTVLQIPLADVLKMDEAKGKLDGSVKFYLAGAKTPAVLDRMGSDTSNSKTNAFNKSDEFACQWAILSSLIRFQDTAKQKGANAVVGLVSYYKKNERSSSRTIECHAGALMAGAALKGTYAKIAR